METPYLLKSNSPFFPPTIPWKTPFYFLYLWIWQLYVPHISGFIWYLSFCDWLISLTIMSSKLIHIRIFFPFEGWINTSLCIYHILFIHLSLRGHKGYFHLLALWIILLWTWVYKYLFEIVPSVLVGIYPEVILLDHMVIPYLIFWGTPMLFSIAVASVCIYTNNA